MEGPGQGWISSVEGRVIRMSGKKSKTPDVEACRYKGKHAIHLDDVAKKENSSTHQFVHSFPLSEPAGWLSRYIYIPTVGGVAVVWSKCTFFTFFSTWPVLSLIVIRLAERLQLPVHRGCPVVSLLPCLIHMDSAISHHNKLQTAHTSQDNDPKHTAKVIRNYLQCKEEQEVLEVMVRPPQSSDLNIIECVWDYMKRQKGLRKPVSTENLCLRTRCLDLLGFQQFMEDSEMTSDLMDEGKELNRQESHLLGEETTVKREVQRSCSSLDILLKIED
ncbi:G-protein coupled receptor-associated protein LMBRD2B-like [Pelmatolapia mariae]|uniref:G-protein coupled receptor-associated protein LMBRD2B-like n=1 Tax=Pelmatolapia mariae TaxID=158779 RepID=UPI002FE68C01